MWNKQEYCLNFNNVALLVQTVRFVLENEQNCINSEVPSLTSKYSVGMHQKEEKSSFYI